MYPDAFDTCEDTDELLAAILRENPFMDVDAPPYCPKSTEEQLELQLEG